MKMWRTSQIPLKIVLAIIPLLIFLWLAGRYFSIGGNLHIEYDFGSISPFIGEWEPRGRALDREKNLRTGETYQQIVGDPVYLPVTVPRSYNSVDVTVEYQNPNQGLLELGIVTNEDPWNIRLLPFENKVIDEAIRTWDTTTQENGVTLIQKEKQFDSVADFEQHMPTDKGVGVYQYEPAVHYVDANYAAQEGTIDVKPYLRGRHEFVTYIKEEPLHIEMDFSDTNKLYNDDPVRVEVKNADGTVVYDDALAGDGEINPTLQTNALGTITIDIPDLPEGVYSINIPVGDDIVMTGLRTTQHKFVAKNRLFSVRNEAYAKAFPQMKVDATTLLTNADALLMRTEDTSGLQTVRVGDDSVHIDTIFEPVEWVSPHAAQQLTQMVLPRNDIIVEGEGYFAFTKESFFDPDYFVQQITQHTDINSLDYIVFKNYTSPVETQRSSLTQTIHVDFEGVAGDRKNLLFILSAPGIDHEKNTVQMNTIQFDFHREPLYRRVLNRFHK